MATETIPLDSLWRGSLSVLNGAPPAHSADSGLWLYLCAFILISLLFVRLFAPVIGRMGYFFYHSSSGLSSVPGGYLFISVCSVLLPSAVAGMIVSSGVLQKAFTVWGTALFLISLLAVKSLLLSLIKFVSRGREPFVEVMYMTVLCLLSLSLVIFIASAAFFFCPELSGSRVWNIIILSLCGASVLAYLIRVTSIILDSGIPVFFTFLYLCTLEYLPVGLLAVTLMRLL